MSETVCLRLLIKGLIVPIRLCILSVAYIKFVTEDKLFELTRYTANTNWKCLRPEKLSGDPNSSTAEDEWMLWLKTFTNFLKQCR